MITGMGRGAYLLALALVIGLGAFLRLNDLGGPSLWYDEIIHVQAANSLASQPWYRHLTGISEVSGWTENGSLYYGLQILGMRLAPGETGVRLFPALVGIMALPLMALCGQLLGGRIAGLTAAFLLAVAPLHVYFSREGRPYSLLMFLALALLYALLLKGSRRGKVVAYAGCLAAAYVGLHSVPILLAFLALAVLEYLRSLRQGHTLIKSPYLHYLLAASIALVLVYGLYMTRSKKYTVDLDQLQTATHEGRSQVSRTQSPVYESPLSRVALQRFLASMTTSGHQSVLPERRSWVLVSLSLVGLVAGMVRRPGEMIATAGMFALPATLSIAALVSVDWWYGLRYTASALPAFLLLVAVGIVVVAKLVGRLLGRKKLEPAREFLTLVAAGTLLGLFAGPNLASARLDAHSKLDWRGVARFFDEVALEDEPILIPNSWPQICLGYYLQELGRDPTFMNLWESSEIGDTTVEKIPRGWLLTAGFRRTNEVRAWMHGFHPVLKKREEEMALFFFPDFSTLLTTRFAAQKGEIFERQFLQMNQRFDFGGAELLLQGGGWSYPEQNTAGIRYQWAQGDRVELGLPIGQPRKALVRFRALPFMYEEAPGQTVEMKLNDFRLTRLELPGGWSEHEVEIPESAWNTGANILRIHFGRSTVPAEVVPGSRDRRNLSAAFDYLEVVTEPR